jgi:hypothetical protein
MSDKDICFHGAMFNPNCPVCVIRKEHAAQIEKICGDVDVARYERDNAERDLVAAQKEIDALNRCVARWQKGDLIEGDFVADDGSMIKDPYAEITHLRAAFRELTDLTLAVGKFHISDLDVDIKSIVDHHKIGEGL